MQILYLKMPARQLSLAKRHCLGALIQTINLPRGQVPLFHQEAQPLPLTAAKFDQFALRPALGNQIW